MKIKPSFSSISDISLNDKLTENVTIFPKFLGELSTNLQSKMLHIKSLMNTGILPSEINDLFKDRFSADSMKIMYLREPYIAKFGFVLITKSFLDIFKEEFSGQKIIEVGAGCGWMAHNLQQAGLDITPIDYELGKNNTFGLHSPYTKILEVRAQDYLPNAEYDTILMSWPNIDSSFACDVLEMMPKGKTLIYIGEGYGGCTANDEFFELLQEKCSEYKNSHLNSQMHQWPGLHDRIHVYKT